MFSEFVSLRKASFCDNELTRIRGLEQNMNLQELALENNNISRISGLETLVELQKLDLGKNKLSQLSNLAHLSKLTVRNICVRLHWANVTSVCAVL